MNNKNRQIKMPLSDNHKETFHKKQDEWEECDEEFEIPDPSEKDLLEINNYDDDENFSDFDEIENNDLNYYIDQEEDDE